MARNIKEQIQKFIEEEQMFFYPKENSMGPKVTVKRTENINCERFLITDDDRLMLLLKDGVNAVYLNDNDGKFEGVLVERDKYSLHNFVPFHGTITIEVE